MVTALEGPHIQAKHYRKLRERQKWGRVVFLGVHTAEGGSKAEDLGGYFQTTGRDVSSHCGIGQDGHYATYVDYDDTAWTMAPVNDDADNCELLGFAAWDRDTWLHAAPLLETFARWLAWRSEVRGIPLKLLTAAEAVKGTPGILMHRTVTEAWPNISTHTDPGPNLPWDVVLARTKELLMPPVPQPPVYDPANQNPWKWDGIKTGRPGDFNTPETYLFDIRNKQDKILDQQAQILRLLKEKK